MIRNNEAIWDRAVRIALGAALLYLGLGGVVTGAMGTALAVVAVLPLLTGVIGWCPVYTLLGVSTSGGKTGGNAIT